MPSFAKQLRVQGLRLVHRPDGGVRVAARRLRRQVGKEAQHPARRNTPQRQHQFLAGLLRVIPAVETESQKKIETNRLFRLHIHFRGRAMVYHSGHGRGEGLCLRVHAP
eukprot:1911540-Pleurochrysis_carterae.AAC.1